MSELFFAFRGSSGKGKKSECRQPDRECSNIATIAVVDIVCFHDLAEETLEEIVAFIGKFCTANTANQVSALLLFDDIKTITNKD